MVQKVIDKYDFMGNYHLYEQKDSMPVQLVVNHQKSCQNGVHLKHDWAKIKFTEYEVNQ